MSAEYRAVFASLRSTIDAQGIGRALSEFVRSIDTGESRFDRFFIGEADALSPAEKRGLQIFRGAGQCASCHLIEGAPPSFTDGNYHAVHLAPLRKIGLATAVSKAKTLSEGERIRLSGHDDEIAALGRFNVTLDPRDIGALRTPSLRNVASTAPYMHDGGIGSLEEAVELELYYRNKRSDRPLILTLSEKADLISFLRALTDETHGAKHPARSR